MGFLKGLSKAKVALALIVILALLQFIRIDKNNPTSDPTKDFLAISNASPEISSLVKAACYDCHSNHTAYPWYTDIAPVSFWIRNHIKGARKQLNFSEWGDYPAGKREHLSGESVEAVETKWMPLNSYVWLHPEAKLSEDDRTKLQDFFKGLAP